MPHKTAKKYLWNAEKHLVEKEVKSKTLVRSHTEL